MMSDSYAVYKGLQKPLIYRGFKGRFIYWGIGSIVGGIALGGFIGAMSNMYFGSFMIVAIISAGLFYTFYKQQQGLHAKTRHKGIFVHQVQLSLNYESKKKTNI